MKNIFKNFFSLAHDDVSTRARYRAFAFIVIGLLSITHLALALGTLLTVFLLYGLKLDAVLPPAVCGLLALGGGVYLAWAWLVSPIFRRFMRWAEGPSIATEAIS